MALPADLEEHLRANSRLPGPRANLELLASASEDLDRETAAAWSEREVGTDPTDVFIIMVGLVALGRSLSQGDSRALATLRHRASDPEWRIREAVAMGLQRLGDDDLRRLAEIATEWVRGNLLEARAAVAALAEPRLLRNGALVPASLDVLDAATAMVERAARDDSDIKVLRQALGYAWSVVVAAAPDTAWPRFQELAKSADPDVTWIVKENMKKDRIRRLGLQLADA